MGDEDKEERRGVRGVGGGEGGRCETVENNDDGFFPRLRALWGKV